MCEWSGCCVRAIHGYTGAIGGCYTGAIHGCYTGAIHGSYTGAIHGCYTGAIHGCYTGAIGGCYTGAILSRRRLLFCKSSLTEYLLKATWKLFETILNVLGVKQLLYPTNNMVPVWY